ncbi:MAG: DDE-type integrase/transposase/recombinase, partial [Bacteroidales bacterium]|nr:DDE-type integrase/transposase/recombinase [Bacteroidales bacterium]
KSVPQSLRNRALLPATGKNWRFTLMNSQRFYDFDTITDYYKKLLPTECELLDLCRRPMDADQCAEYLKENIVAIAEKEYTAKQLADITAYYMAASDVTFNPDTARSLAECYAVALYAKKMREGENFKRWGFDLLKDFDNALIDFYKEKQYPNFKPGSSDVLRRKLAAIAEPSSLISEKFGNTNAALVKKTEVVDTDTGEVLDLSLHELVMYGLWNGLGAQHGFLNKERKIALHAQYCAEMERYGYKDRVMSYRTFCAHTAKWETKMFRSYGRDGATVHNNLYRPFTLTQGVLNPMSLWVADGTGTKMVFQYRGQMRTLYRVNIFDVMSQKIVGYSLQTKIGYHQDKEEAWMFIDALKMAMETCGGRVAQELLTDNGGAFAKGDTQEICRLLFPKYRTINPGNSQENQAETLQRLVFNFCRRYSNFVGSRMGAIKDDNRTTNFDGLDISKLPTFEEAVNQQIEMVNEWNSAKGSDGLSPDERFFGDLEIENGKLKIDDDVEFGFKPSETIIRRALGMKTTVNLSRMRGKLAIEHDGSTYYYEIDLAKNGELLNRKTGYKPDAVVTVCHDGQTADLYNQDGVFIISLQAVNKAFKALCEADEASGKGMAEQMQIRADFDQKVAENINLIDEMRFRLPDGEITDYGYAVATRSKVKPEIQDYEEILLNEQLTVDNEQPKRSDKPKVLTTQEQAFADF